MRKFFTLLISAALLSTLTAYAQKAQYSSLIARETLGNADAAFQLYRLAQQGQLYENAADNQNAVQRYLNRAADLGSIPARFQIAKTTMTSTSAYQSGQKIAFEYLLDLSTKTITREFTREDFFETNYLLGECYERGKGISPNLNNAIRYYLFASLYNDNARMALARIFLRASDTAKYKANMNISMMEFFGVYMLDSKRLPEIVQYLRAAKRVDEFSRFLEQKADAGDGIAAMFLADSTFTGTIFPKEVTKSLKYYEEAVKCGMLEAALKLGDIYAYGSNFVPVDKEKALKLYERALYSTDNKVRSDAAKRLIENAKKEGDQHVIFKYMMLGGFYDDARRLIRTQDLSWSAQDIYLKAKEFQSRLAPNDRNGQSEYRERLHMASNAGYFLAVQDYFKEVGSREYSRMIQALEADPLPEDPEWLYMLSVCYRSGGTANKLRDFKKSLKYMQQAADLGNVTSMDLLIRLYSTGAAQYGVPQPQPDMVKKYTDMILRYDAELRYPDYFTKYLEDLEKSGGEKSREQLTPAIRSVELSPLAAMALSRMYMKGNEDFQIKKDEMFAFVLLHIAAMNGYQPAIDEIVKVYNYGIPDLIDADKAFANKYTAIRGILPRGNAVKATTRNTLPGPTGPGMMQSGPMGPGMMMPGPMTGPGVGFGAAGPGPR